MKSMPGSPVRWILLAFLFFASAIASAKSPASWQAQFAGLAPGMPRLAAEKQIALVRNVASTYDLWAMDTSAHVAYRLDADTILLVTYKPGVPAARTIDGHGGQGPLDGVLLEYELIALR
jgi:hypothetical protein